MDSALASHLHDWLNLLLRWAHFITGVAWIGASFYFNWLENHLERRARAADAGAEIAGDLWAVHGGGFYYLQKFEVAPPKLPTTLHWFKYEAYFTWITGFALLVSLYYLNAGVYMIDGAVADLTAFQAVNVGLAALAFSWFFYDGLCRSPLRENNAFLGLILFGWFAGLAWILTSLLSGRAAYIHVGAAIGTIMVANVFTVIIPAQKDMVAALSAGNKPDGAKGRNALLRSRHNNYFTLPVLFIMISNHYPATYGHALNWVVLAVISLAGVGVRHYFNVRHIRGHSRWVLPISLVVLAVAVVMTLPAMRAVETGAAPAVDSGAVQAETAPAPGTEKAFDIVQERCTGCHSRSPTLAGFTAPPLGVSLDSVEDLKTQAPRVFQTTVITRTMPLANLTKMTEEERDSIARWYAGRLQGND